MLNKDNQRELAYVVEIDWIEPIEGADNIELVGINGWTCIAKKGEFKPHDLAVYFEIDSKLPEEEWAAFLAPKHYKVKTMKLGKFNVISQGLALPADAFGWENLVSEIKTPEGKSFIKGDFLTKELNVKYSVDEDNKRKAPSVNKYKAMVDKFPKVFSRPSVRWLMKRNWGKRIMYLLYGNKVKVKEWPFWVTKTDEERVENMPWVLKNKEEWFATEKIDGTSTTFTMRRGRGFKALEYHVCSRNVTFAFPKNVDRCYYDTNVYLEMAEKYNIKEILWKMLELDDSLEFVTIQGETYGAGVQKRDYSMKDHDLAVFNVIFGYRDGYKVRLNPHAMKEQMDNYNIPCVPILDEHFVLPDTIDELRAYVNSKTSEVDGKMREGIVFRSYDATQSFKCVSPEYLLKYHG